MRYKVVPEPLGLDTLEAVHRALPLVPERVEDCCTRVVDRTAVTARDDAREWITFLEALELAEETQRGFKRVRSDQDAEGLADAFERQVFGARELLEALREAGSLSPEEAFAAVRPTVPAWERDRHTDWEGEWRDRTRRLLEWAVAFDLATFEDRRYAAVDRS